MMHAESVRDACRKMLVYFLSTAASTSSQKLPGSTPLAAAARWIFWPARAVLCCCSNCIRAVE